MATICLRGKLTHSSDGKWTWKGEWAFGDKMDNGGLPFDYAFSEPQDPTSIADPPNPTSDSKSNDVARYDPTSSNSQERLKVEEKGEVSNVADSQISATVATTTTTNEASATIIPTTNPVQAAITDTPAEENQPAVQASIAPTLAEPEKKDPSLAVAAIAPPEPNLQEKDASLATNKTGTTVSTSATSDEPNPIVMSMDQPLPRTVQIHEHTLPASGKWTGHFMTLGTARKGTTPPHVPVTEHFSIAWDSEYKESSPLIQLKVVGKGENQYGRFSLVGSLHLTSFTLQLQRQYIISAVGSSGSTQRSYQTRKRQLTWKRRAALDQEPMQLKKLPPPAHSKKSKLAIHLPHSNATATTTTSSMGPRKRQVLAKQPVGPIKLPAAGEPLQARWRAAHFFHYQPAGPDKGPKYVVYEGELFQRKRHGRGVCLYNNGLLYEGEWKMDKECGSHGTLMTADRQRVLYEGAWERGRMHGEGIYRYSEKSHYAGEFRENLRHGDGSYRLEDGSVYDGAWRDGAMCGRGIFTWPDGSVYDGEWKDSKRHGMGVLKTADGFTYDGAWVMNSMEGRGSATYPSGQEYHGMWSRGRREGRGTIHFTNGAVYEGRFKNDAIDGQGTLKISRTLNIPNESEEGKPDFMIPVSFQSDLGHIHRKAGFTNSGK